MRVPGGNYEVGVVADRKDSWRYPPDAIATFEFVANVRVLGNIHDVQPIGTVDAPCAFVA